MLSAGFPPDSHTSELLHTFVPAPPSSPQPCPPFAPPAGFFPFLQGSALVTPPSEALSDLQEPPADPTHAVFCVFPSPLLPPHTQAPLSTKAPSGLLPGPWISSRTGPGAFLQGMVTLWELLSLLQSLSFYLLSGRGPWPSGAQSNAHAIPVSLPSLKWAVPVTATPSLTFMTTSSAFLPASLHIAFLTPFQALLLSQPLQYAFLRSFVLDPLLTPPPPRSP